MNTLAAGGTSVTSVIGTIAGVIGLIAAYWFPTIIAFMRHVPAKSQVVIVNLFLGWTFVGWVVALVMACRTVPAATPGQLLRPPNGV
jgi:ABC-type lipoprotein release transport system permease subunit